MHSRDIHHQARHEAIEAVPLHSTTAAPLLGSAQKDGLVRWPWRIDRAFQVAIGEHLEQLLAKVGHDRGTDLRQWSTARKTCSLTQLPCGFGGKSSASKADAHINVLDAQALFAHVRRVLGDLTVRGCRIPIVIDSQVLYGGFLK